MTKRVAITRDVIFHENTTSPSSSTVYAIYVSLFSTTSSLSIIVAPILSSPFIQDFATITGFDNPESSRPTSPTATSPKPLTDSATSSTHPSCPQQIRKLVQFYSG
jgi:hypothetical protein